MTSNSKGEPASAGRQTSSQASPPTRNTKYARAKTLKNDADRFSTVLAEIESADLAQLRALWLQYLGSEAPRFRSTSLFAGMLAWRIQAEAFGGLDSWTVRRLKQLAVAFEKDPDHRPNGAIAISPGVVLTREWKGILHRILVERDGFVHKQLKYKTLTEVASAITGTHWSGPRFFGLEKAADKRKKGRR
ncbi:MAG: DUF2924 domain-containing protein [Alphaproteobacteria bacterium]